MRASRIGLFAAVFAIGACVGDPPDFSRNPDGGEGTGASIGDGGGPGTGGEAAEGRDGGGADEGTASGIVTKAVGASCANADGGGACEGAAPVCCAVQDARGFDDPTYAYAEKPAGCASLDGGVAVQCRTACDCSGGYVCCGRKEEHNTGMFATVMCEPSCTGVYTAGQDLFCDPNDPHACDSDSTSPYCEPSQLLPGMFYCSSE